MNLQDLEKDGFKDQFDAEMGRRPPVNPSTRRSNLVLYTKDGHSLSMENHWREATCFLVLSGPSTKELNLKLLERRGVVTMCVNNSWSLIKPTIWTAVDNPSGFMDTGWKDPSILKLVPYGKVAEKLGVRKDKGFRWSAKQVCDMPNILMYKRNEKFVLENYLTEDTVNWGNHKKFQDKLGCRGSRSVMLAAMRLLYYFGFSKVYLVGADFNMVEGQQNYGFPQERTPESCVGNNNTYRDLDIRFKALRPLMEATGFRVFNTNPKSKLEAFDHVPYEDACREFDKFQPPEGGFKTDGWYTWFKAKKVK